MAREVTQETFAIAPIDGALVDAREADERAPGHLSGMWLMPPGAVPARELPALAGATGAWARDGRPLAAGSHRPAA